MGLERVAEELMGRRKWKLYQEALARSQLNVNAANLVQNNTQDTSNTRLDCLETQEKPKLALLNQLKTPTENHLNENDVVTIKKEISENTDEKGCAVSEKGNLAEQKHEDPKGNSEISITNSQGGADSEEYNNSSCPIDWKPNDKCYFCVDGKLLTVNEKGDLVAESGPAQSEAELANRQTSLDSDSDSSDSSPENEVQIHTGNNAKKSVTSLLRDSLPPNMTSSLAAQLVAVAQIQGIQPDLTPFYSGLWYQLAQQVSPATPTTSETNIAALSPSHKDSPSPSDTTGEQPLDLSAKPSPNSSGGHDPKQTFRAKPRVTPIAGRRTYSEEELQSALNDIISGKLGTRRAAVLYGIPRSTLRNKVYKIAMEQKREVSTIHRPVLEALAEQDDDDKDSGDDEKDEKLLSGLLDEDLARYTASRLNATTLQSMHKVTCENNQVADPKPEITIESLSKRPQSTSQPQTPPIAPPWLDPNVLLHSLLLSGGLGGLPGLPQPTKQEEQANLIQELLKRLMLQQQELMKGQMKNSTSSTSDILNNGKAGISDPRLLMNNFPMQPNAVASHHHHHQQQQQQHISFHYSDRVRKAETPEILSNSIDMTDVSDDPSVILKIPSYKPVAGSSTSGKNGEGLSSPTLQITPPILSRSPQQSSNLPGISPPLIRQNSESHSPPILGGKGILSLRDVIAKSISRTFNQQANKEVNLMMNKHPLSENSDPYKRPSISVIKSLGGNEFANAPNLLSSAVNNNAQNQAANSLGGKGTRPKRGKYRNYDRDSLVEAVKAVQRGEMSVHRAGSYYGVPHSTLEYKVKERHLMRPRKREPKPQPLDDRGSGGGGTGSTSTNSKNSNIPGIAGSTDKMKSSAAIAQSKALKNNPPFPSTSPNGMKVPMFDPAMTAAAAAQIPYSNLFWATHPHGFGTIPIDFARTPGCRPNSTGFPTNPETFLASQMMQQFQEESQRHSSGTSNSLNVSGGSASAAMATSPASIASSSKAGLNSMAAAAASSSSSSNPRDLVESRYDGVGANGSFLDGIIRQSLERNTSDIPHGVLLDQLVKNTRLLKNSSCSNDSSLSGSKGSKRSISPVLFPGVDIKRERSSPSLNLSNNDIDPSCRERDISQESVETLLKLRDGLALKSDEKFLQLQQQQSLLHHQTLQQHHVQQQQSHPIHQQPASSSNLRHISIEDVNGSSSSGNVPASGNDRQQQPQLQHQQQLDNLGQIKTETEDSL